MVGNIAMANLKTNNQLQLMSFGLDWPVYLTQILSMHIESAGMCFNVLLWTSLNSFLFLFDHVRIWYWFDWSETDLYILYSRLKYLRRIQRYKAVWQYHIFKLRLGASIPRSVGWSVCLSVQRNPRWAWRWGLVGCRWGVCGDGVWVGIGRRRKSKGRGEGLEVQRGRGVQKLEINIRW